MKSQRSLSSSFLSSLDDSMTSRTERSVSSFSPCASPVVATHKKKMRPLKVKSMVDLNMSLGELNMNEEERQKHVKSQRNARKSKRAAEIIKAESSYNDSRSFDDDATYRFIQSMSDRKKKEVVDSILQNPTKFATASREEQLLWYNIMMMCNGDDSTTDTDADYKPKKKNHRRSRNHDKRRQYEESKKKTNQEERQTQKKRSKSFCRSLSSRAFKMVSTASSRRLNKDT